MIDITNEDAVSIDGITVPTHLIRMLASADASAIRIETSRGRVEETEIERHPEGAITFRSKPSGGQGHDGRPVETVILAELRDGRGASAWVFRGSDREAELKDLGWKERGATKPRESLDIAHPR